MMGKWEGVIWTTSCHDIRAFLELDMKYRQFIQIINQTHEVSKDYIPPAP
jgi:hypothetical protein